FRSVCAVLGCRPGPKVDPRQWLATGLWQSAVIQSNSASPGDRYVHRRSSCCRSPDCWTLRRVLRRIWIFHLERRQENQSELIFPVSRARKAFRATSVVPLIVSNKVSSCNVCNICCLPRIVT